MRAHGRRRLVGILDAVRRRDLLLDLGDLLLETDDVRVLVAVRAAQRAEVLLQACETLDAALGTGGGGRQRRCVGQLPGQRLAPLEGTRLIVAVEPQLHVEPLDGAEVRVGLLRQLAHVALLELADNRLLAVEALLDVGELCLQKLRRAGGLPLAGLEILFDVERGERVRHPGDELGVPAGIAQGKRDRRAAQVFFLLD